MICILHFLWLNFCCIYDVCCHIYSTNVTLSAMNFLWLANWVSTCNVSLLPGFMSTSSTIKINRERSEIIQVSDNSCRTFVSHIYCWLVESSTMELRRKIALHILPLFLAIFLFTMGEAYLKSVRVDEIPFAGRKTLANRRSSGIHLISSLEHQRTFLHLFHVPCELSNLFCNRTCYIQEWAIVFPHLTRMF